MRRGRIGGETNILLHLVVGGHVTCLRNAVRLYGGPRCVRDEGEERSTERNTRGVTGEDALDMSLKRRESVYASV